MRAVAALLLLCAALVASAAATSRTDATRARDLLERLNERLHADFERHAHAEILAEVGWRRAACDSKNAFVGYCRVCERSFTRARLRRGCDDCRRHRGARDAFRSQNRRASGACDWRESSLRIGERIDESF